MDYLNLPSGRFAYVRQGRGSPVLLLHGLGSSLLDWQPQIEHLAQHCEVFALDVRGHGQSEPLRAPVESLMARTGRASPPQTEFTPITARAEVQLASAGDVK